MTCDQRLKFAVLLSLSVVACGKENSASAPDANDERIEVVESRGAVCLSTQGARVDVKVVFAICLADSCDEVRSANCAVSVTGNSVDVSSRLEVLGPGRDAVCPGDCQLEFVECGTLEVDDGVYQVTHGSESVGFTFPFDGEQQLFGTERQCEIAQQVEAEQPAP